MSVKDRIKLIAADTLARVVVYGPLAVLAVVFMPAAALPTLIVLGMAAAQPWFGDGFGRLDTYLTKKFPDAMTPVNDLLTRYVGMQWWKHAGVAIGLVAAAVVPTPAILGEMPGFIKTVVDAVGGADGIWTQYALPFALATGLPLATRLATDGFEAIFQAIPFLRDASIQRQAQRIERKGERAAIRLALREPGVAPTGSGTEACNRCLLT